MEVLKDMLNKIKQALNNHFSKYQRDNNKYINNLKNNSKYFK